MASNQHTGLNPLNIPRVDATESGINSAFATISREIAERTPRESLGEGSIHTGAGTFSVPATAIEQVRPRHAFHAVVYMDAADSSTVKANFQAAYVIEQDDTQFPVFATEADQTRSVLDGEKYWVKILVNNDYEVQSASFIQAATTTDVDPSPTSNGEIYKLCVEFDEDAAGKLVVTYHRFNSIIYRPPDTSSTSSHPWKVTGNGDATVDVAAGKLLSFVSESAPGVSSIPSYFQLKEFADYAGGTIGSIGAAGFIYASISYTTNQTIFEADTTTGISTFDRVVPDGAIAVAFATSLPTTGDVFIVELARVAFASGIATVSDQVVTHNPTLWSFDIAPEPP